MGGYELGASSDLDGWMRSAPHAAVLAMLDWVTRLRVDPYGAASGPVTDGAGRGQLIAHVEEADVLVAYAVMGRVIRISAVISAH